VATLEELQAEAKPYIGTLVLSIFDVVRLENVVDGEDDYYWIYTGLKQKYWSSCVGGFIPLKGVLPDKDYDSLVHIFNLNCIPDIEARNKMELQDKLKEIEEQWKDEKLWEEKEDVFDFMRKHFDFLLENSKKFIERES
jgi:hypothetical protein